MPTSIYLSITTREDLDRLISEGIEESLTLDYKASPSLARVSKQIEELCKDVSAFANSAGGQIVYGLTENKTTHKPDSVDAGVSDPKITREWIEQVLLSRINPRIQGVKIERIDLENGGFGYCLTIPPTNTGPHQAPDKKYYKRYDLQSIPMEDYEVRDVLRRSTTPSLRASFEFRTGSRYLIQLEEGAAIAAGIPLIVTIHNDSDAPASQVVMNVHIPVEYAVPSSQGIDPAGSRPSKGQMPEMRILRKTVISPPNLPVFREDDTDIHSSVINLKLTRDQVIHPQEPIDIEVTIRAPGFHSVEYWSLYKQGRYLNIGKPGSEWAFNPAAS